MSAFSRPIKLITNLFSDQGLTKKAYLNALTVILDYGATLIVGFFITPLMVAGLGNYLFGMWQVLNRLIGYISPASGRPAFALKATLANQQASSDFDQKRRYVGSTITIWIFFLPILVVIGGIVTWFVPYWVQAPSNYVWIVRAVSGLLVMNMIVDTLSSIPQVTLQGENLGYKRIGLSALMVIFGGGLTWLALYSKAGIIGVAAAVVATTIATGGFYFWVVKTYAPWFGSARPRSADVRQMLGLSWWFMGWNLVTTLLLASDVVVLGLLNSVESVTNYTLTKYVPETLIGVIVIVIFGIMPGLGSIIGTGDYARAIRIRDEINSFIWVVATTLGSSILIWNRVFVGLWIGSDHYSGALPNLLIVVIAMQLALIRSDGNIIDLTLHMSQKVILGLVSVTVSIAAASIMVAYFRAGIVGLCLGIIGGRLIISIGYPLLINRYLNNSSKRKMYNLLRPAIVTSILFSLTAWLDESNLLSSIDGLSGWFPFIAAAGATGIILLLVSFYTGLSKSQRAIVLQRLQALKP